MFRWSANRVRTRRPHILPCTDSFRLLSYAIVLHAISDCLLSIDNRGCLVRFCSSKVSINSLHCCSHAVFVIVLSRIACSIKSCSTCAIKLINDVIWLNLSFLYQYVHYLTPSRFISILSFCIIKYTIWQRRISFISHYMYYYLATSHLYYIRYGKKFVAFFPLHLTRKTPHLTEKTPRTFSHLILH